MLPSSCCWLVKVRRFSLFCIILLTKDEKNKYISLYMPQTAIKIPPHQFKSCHQQLTVKVSKLNSPIVSHSDIIEESEGKNDRSSTTTMALINMQSVEHSCSNSSTLCVLECVWEREWENGKECVYSDSLGALENINRFCFVTVNRLKGINAWDRVEEKRPPSQRKEGCGEWSVMTWDVKAGV